MFSGPADVSDATLRLLLARGVGPSTLRKLRAHFGDDESILSASVSQLEKINGIGRKTAEALQRAIEEANPDDERRAMAQHGARLITSDRDEFPPLLATIPDPPKALWVRGEFTADDQLAVAVVGSRRCTAYGREQAGRFAANLAQSGLTIVSGGALGIDGEAHRGALRVNGRTIVVLGCGVSVPYPSEHRSLFDRVVESGGAVVSEYPMRTPPIAENFPRRNRIISGLSLGVLVIEAAARSGALITARLAAEEQGREVMALPGRVDSPASLGCLQLIRDGGAAVVLDHADVIRQLDAARHLLTGARGLRGDGADESPSSLLDGYLTDAQRTILSALDDANGPLSLDALCARCQIPMSTIMSELTLLQIRGRITRDHQGVHARSRD